MTTSNDAARLRDPLGLALLAVGVVSVGAAAILVRLADAPALTVALWRMLLGGTTLLAVCALLRRRLPRGTSLRAALVAGVLLGAHFGMWIASLSMTSVAASVVLVCLQPVFVVLFGRVLLRETIDTRVVSGIMLALIGGVVTAGATDGVRGNAPLQGNLLALGGAVAIALYVLAGRRAARDIDVLGYSALVSLVAAVTLGVAALVLDAPLWPTQTDAGSSSWPWILALAWGPQVIGHTALNAALARLPAAVVSGSILGEPVIATALAWIVLHEQPGPLVVVGSVLSLAGVWRIVRSAA